MKIFDYTKPPFPPQTVTLVTGYYDLLHPGHVLFLKKCKEIGLPLVVGVRSDKSSKKSGRPIMHEKDRAFMVAALDFVDYVFIDHNDYNDQLLQSIKPQKIIFSSGEKPSPGKKSAINFLKNNYPDIKLCYIPRQRKDISTTTIIDKVVTYSENKQEFKEINLKDLKSIYNYLLKISNHSNATIKNAAIIISNTPQQILSIGTNYHPSFRGKIEYSSTNTHEYKTKLPRPIHAEIDAILNLGEVSKYPQMQIYSIYMPCAGCAEFIARLDIKQVFYFKNFDNNFGELIFKKHHVKLTKLKF